MKDMSEDKLLKKLTESYNEMEEVFDTETGVEWDDDDDTPLDTTNPMDVEIEPIEGEEDDMDLYKGAGESMGIDEDGLPQPEVNKMLRSEDGLDHQIAAFFPEIRKADILQFLDHSAPKKTESKAILDFLKYLRSRGQV